MCGEGSLSVLLEPIDAVVEVFAEAIQVPTHLLIFAHHGPSHAMFDEILDLFDQMIGRTKPAVDCGKFSVVSRSAMKTSPF